MMPSDLVRDTHPDEYTKILDLYGLPAAQEFSNMYTSQRSVVSVKIANLESVPDPEFVELASWAITDSARMNSFRGNFEDVHVVATIAYEISRQRAAANGTHPECRIHSLYQRAWIRAYTQQGHYYDRSEDVCICEE